MISVYKLHVWERSCVKLKKLAAVIGGLIIIGLLLGFGPFFTVGSDLVQSSSSSTEAPIFLAGGSGLTPPIQPCGPQEGDGPY